MRHIGVDTGGTFTDFLSIEEESKEVSLRKLPSTPDDPARAILEGTGSMDAPFDLVHGSTVATNTLLERRGARLAMIVTAGFEDVIEIGRQDRPDIYDLRWRPPEPLVASELRIPVRERIGPGGQVIEPLAEDEVARVVTIVDKLEPEAVCVCLLFSPENGAHEHALLRALQPLGIPVVLSSVVHGEIREYERFSTTAISAYVAPVIDRYMERLSKDLGARRFRVMESGGGVMAWERLRGQAVRTVLSGPAGGVVGARAFADGRSVVSFDMGGTSTDVSLIESGEIPHTRSFRIGHLPVAVPLVDIHTVGAGGGSEAWVDPGGALRVGPRSAGAMPGPICYGRGGRTVTVTDANCFLGRLPKGTRLGGEMALDIAPLGDAFRELGAALGLSAVEAARGVVRVVEAEMERALRKMTQERGVDPRTLSLVAFGGAGALHAVALARSLGMKDVLVPPDPGVMSARGMLLAPEIETTTRAVVEKLDRPLLERLTRDALEREEASRRALSHSGESPDIRVRRVLSLRYQGQSHELEVDWTEDPVEEFHRKYALRYGFAEPDRAVEVTAARSIVLVESLLSVQDLAPSSGARGDAVHGETPVLLGSDESPTAVPLVNRDELAAGASLSGPAVIQEKSSTLWLPPRARLSVESDSALRILDESQAKAR